MRDLNLTSINDVHRLEKSRYNPELVELNQAMKHYKENGTFEDFEFDMWNKYANGLIWLPDEIDDGRQIEIMSILLSGPNGVNKLYDISNHTINNTLAHNLNKNGLIEKVKTKKIFIGNLGGKGVLCNNRTSYQKTSLGEELTDHLMNTTFNTNEH